MKCVVMEQYGLQKPQHPRETDMKQKLLGPVMATERIGSWEMPSPVGRELGWGGGRNTGSQIQGIQLLCFLSRAVLLLACVTPEISSL